MIKVNIDKAKRITKERLRNERKPLLEKLDVDFIRAQEQGLDTTEIVQEKQRLRDITDKVDVCSTPEELKAIHCEGV